MKKKANNIRKSNELRTISMLLLLSALIYTVYILNIRQNVAPQRSQAVLSADSCEANFTAVASPSPTPPKITLTPTPPKITLTPTPPVVCYNYGINERSGSFSDLVKITLTSGTPNTSMELIRKLECDSDERTCDGEGMDNFPGTKDVYFIANEYQGNENPAIYKVTNKENGSYTRVTFVNRSFNTLSFRPGTKVLWAWDPGNGIYTINLTTGATTLVKSSSLDIHAMTWNKNGSKLYAAQSTKLYVWDPANPGSINQVGTLPGDTDGMDITDDGSLVGLYKVSGGAMMYFYDISLNKVTKTYKITSFVNMSSSDLNNIDGFTWLCGNSPQ